MRAASTFSLILLLGCSTTVTRLEGDIATPAGPPRSECEEQAWLVLAPTEYEAVVARGTASERRTDGLGLYGWQDDRAQSIPGLDDELGPSPLLPPHRDGTRVYDRDRVIAAVLGGLGIVGMGIGAGLFATSFHTETTGVAPFEEEQQVIDRGRAVAGSLFMGLGFAVSIAGLAINPTHAERARANTARYVFVAPADDPKAVSALVDEHNDTARAACAREPSDE